METILKAKEDLSSLEEPEAAVINKMVIALAGMGM